mmetsp:Transcript_38625/g.95550  ORF Transcript_38625/g.95550 Transcript_38625/m.95550 type:complete len:227 (-) Transcript_38625:505-1185(-)
MAKVVSRLSSWLATPAKRAPSGELATIAKSRGVACVAAASRQVRLPVAASISKRHMHEAGPHHNKAYSHLPFGCSRRAAAHEAGCALSSGCSGRSSCRRVRTPSCPTPRAATVALSSLMANTKRRVGCTTACLGPAPGCAAKATSVAGAQMPAERERRQTQLEPRLGTRMIFSPSTTTAWACGPSCRPASWSMKPTLAPRAYRSTCLPSVSTESRSSSKPATEPSP